MPVLLRVLLAGAAGVIPAPAFAAEGLGGASFGIPWAIPFLGILLSIALFPLFAHRVWEHHQGKVAAFWGVLAVVPLALLRGVEPTAEALVHTLLAEYLPFILLLLALFTTAGGVLVAGNIHGSPRTNTVLLALGGVLASLIGTTGASMVLIRPMLRANDNRRHNAHVFIFFIFVVSNLGGALTPLGDPPLFLGYLRGVDFFWTTTHIAAETAFAAGLVLAVFFAIDTVVYRREGVKRDPTPDKPVRVRGIPNMILIGVIVAAVLASGTWKPGVSWTLMGSQVELQNVLRDLVLAGVTVVSLLVTKAEYRAANGFTWGPILEVAKLFAGIFVAMIPVIAMLRAGSEGAFAPLVALVSHAGGSANPAAYFWLTGGLSSFLDNAPTYLVFFELAGGDATHLMGEGALTLAAISCGAVFMGANTYIGNAPNFMVYAMARAGRVSMPSFFGYMVWSGTILVPVFLLVTLVFFR